MMMTTAAGDIKEFGAIADDNHNISVTLGDVQDYVGNGNVSMNNGDIHFVAIAGDDDVSVTVGDTASGDDNNENDHDIKGL